ncbi:Hypothetical predicted protein [Paramuricea clavata]|uniref:Uncharacterized protein n=1 Tax=Paramuricea clavata TaxID=317549 RepID=A0A6S7K6X0_PARCT|nr:Hypothetical predicted protein [Paramuricea clavata]
MAYFDPSKPTTVIDTSLSEHLLKKAELTSETDLGENRLLETKTDALYDCEVVYNPGKDAENPADFLSRHPNPVDSSPTDNMTTDAYINYLCTNLIRKAMKLHEVKRETASDPVLCKLSEAITHNRWLRLLK